MVPSQEPTPHLRGQPVPDVLRDAEVAQEAVEAHSAAEPTRRGTVLKAHLGGPSRRWPDGRDVQDVGGRCARGVSGQLGSAV